MMATEFPTHQNGDSRDICNELNILQERITSQIEQYEEQGRRWDILHPERDATTDNDGIQV